MIALCPECKTRYRLAREKVGPQGVRIRCSKCQTVFRVQPPKPAQPPASPPPAEQAVQLQQSAQPSGKSQARALVAESDHDAAERIVACLSRWKIAADVVSDGGQALLSLFRDPPDVAILGGHLPGVSAPMVAEIARRSAELRTTSLVRIAPIDEPAGTPEFEANEMVEPGEVGARLEEILGRLGVGEAPAAEPKSAEPTEQAESHPASEPAPAPQRRRSEPSSDDPAIVSAERLARVAVSDIILYNEEKFAKAVSEGNIATLLQSELDEARHMFEQRVPEEVRALRDFLFEELERRAAARA